MISLVCAREDRALERFDALLDEGIELHVQIVLVPGVNDGPVLQESLNWLAEREGVLSVGIVPLGYTAHQQRFEASFESAVDAAAVIAEVVPWQQAMRDRDGCTWVYLADEFYLNAGVDLPPAAEYDDFPQYENGIGLVREFLDTAHDARSELARAMADLPAGTTRDHRDRRALRTRAREQVLGAVDDPAAREPSSASATTSLAGTWAWPAC